MGLATWFGVGFVLSIFFQGMIDLYPKIADDLAACKCSACTGEIDRRVKTFYRLPSSKTEIVRFK
jgi:hypothetical protein